jgi:hypothetical protein
MDDERNEIQKGMAQLNNRNAVPKKATHVHTERKTTLFGVHPPPTTTTRAFFFHLLPFVSEYWYNILISRADNILPSSFKKEKENRKDSNSYALYIYSSIVSRV